MDRVPKAGHQWAVRSRARGGVNGGGTGLGARDALAMFAAVRRAIGSLDAVRAWLTVDGYVNASPGYAQMGGRSRRGIRSLSYALLCDVLMAVGW